MVVWQLVSVKHAAKEKEETSNTSCIHKCKWN
jgi:hypothetical protein